MIARIEKNSRVSPSLLQGHIGDVAPGGGGNGNARYMAGHLCRAIPKALAAANHHLRQQKAGAQLRWKTPPVAKGSSKRITFVFLGAMGYLSQPKTEGFALLLQGKGVLRFDLSKKDATWQSDDGQVEFFFQPTWTSSQDAAGFFYLSVPRDLITLGKPCEIGIRSLGSGSARWFALHPVTGVVKLQSKTTSRANQPDPKDSAGRDDG